MKLLEEKFFEVHFPGGNLATDAFWEMNRVKNMEPCPVPGSNCLLHVSTFGKSAENDLNRIIKRFGGRIQ